MKKSQGIRVGKKLLSVWRWVRRRRRFQPGRRNYSRLDSIASPPRRQQYFKERKATPSKIADWGRLLSRLTPSSLRRVSNREELLGDYRIPKPPPKGHLAVYVSLDGEIPHRAVVPVAFFNHPLFAELLLKAEKEFGYEQSGGITIPCPVSDFEGVCTVVANEVSCRHRASRRLL